MASNFDRMIKLADRVSEKYALPQSPFWTDEDTKSQAEQIIDKFQNMTDEELQIQKSYYEQQRELVIKQRAKIFVKLRELDDAAKTAKSSFDHLKLQEIENQIKTMRHKDYALHAMREYFEHILRNLIDMVQPSPLVAFKKHLGLKI